VTQVEAVEDAQWMRMAMKQAQTAGAAGEVPVGAVVVCQGQIIGIGQNAPIHTRDPSAHAEVLALRAAALHLGNYRLDDCELFVTLEPCAMCAGAILHARLKRVVFAAADPKTGAAGSVIDLFGNPRLNHHTQVQGGVLAHECSELLQGFFRQQRQQKSASASPVREDALRTPASRFDTLPALPGTAKYVMDLPALKGLRLHYVDAGSTDLDQVTLCLHGGLSWSQVWLQVMPERVALGERVLAIDLIGFGKSDKLKKASAYSMRWHALVVVDLIDRLNLKNVVLLELADDTLPGLVKGESIGGVLMALAGGRITRRESVQVEPLSPQALSAPYPDQGHCAALCAFTSKKKNS
jgi:tRNA(adenine34) deaminase